MTLKQLTEKVRVGLCMSGQFRVDITYRGWDYWCPSHNTLAYDVIRDWKRDNVVKSTYYTPKQAYEALWDECKRYNKL